LRAYLYYGWVKIRRGLLAPIGADVRYLLMVTQASHPRTVRIFRTADEVERTTAARIVTLARNAIAKHGRFNVALSSGATPRGVYRRLVAEFGDAIDWQRVHFYWTDEFLRSEGARRSNFETLQHALLDPLRVSQANVHPVVRRASAFEVVSEYERQLEDLPRSTDDTPAFDLIVLNLGKDGHMASLFPKLACETRDGERGWVTHVKHLERDLSRISLTLDVLNAARHVLFTAVGRDRAQALQRALSSETRSAPASRVRLVNGSLEWYVDQGACEALEQERWLAGVT
jgi:6-phosphogluconolactonase